MDNIHIIKAEHTDDYIFNLWSTEEFRHLHKTHIFFYQLLQELKKRSLFFYDIKYPEQEKYSTSIFNFIAYKKYDNLYIQDLHYFKALVQCAHYNKFVNPYLPYEQWQIKLEYNGLYSFIFSDILIYLFDPTILNNIKNDLWIYDIINRNEYQYNKDPITNLPYLNKQEFFYLDHLSKSDHFFYLLDNFEQNSFLFNIIQRRQHLKYIKTNSNEFNHLSSSEKDIVSYIKSHQRWLNNWYHQYMYLENHFFDFSKNTTTDDFFLNIVLNSKKNDIYERPFMA